MAEQNSPENSSGALAPGAGEVDLKFDPMSFAPIRVGQWGFFPMFAPPLGSGRPASTPLELWLSFFPTAPMFGLRWMFADMAQAAAPAEPLNEHEREQTALSSVRLRSRAPEEEKEAGSLSDIAAMGGLSARFTTDAPAARLRVVEETPAKKAETPAKTSAQTPAKAPAEPAPAPKKTVAKKAVTGEAVAAPAEKTPAKASPAEASKAKTGPAKTDPAKTSKAPAAKTAAKAAVETKPAAAKPTGSKPVEKKAPAKKAAAKKPAATGPRPTRKPGQPFATYDAAPPKPDDLTRIKGVGEKLAAVLNDRGIYTFDQIAAFDKAAYQWLDDTLGAFKGRGERDDWAGQAKALMKG